MFQKQYIYFRNILKSSFILLTILMENKMKRANLPVSKIASIANVSPATVSRVLNHPELVNKETKELIEKAILDAGFDIEKVMQKKIDQNKRILLAVLPSIDNPFYNNIMKGFKTSANSHQFDVVSGEYKQKQLGSLFGCCKNVQCPWSNMSQQKNG